MNNSNFNQDVSTKEPSAKQKFEKSNKYFTISIYALMVIAGGSLAAKCILDPGQLFSGFQRLFNMLMPFLIGLLIAYILNPFVKNIFQLLNVKCKLKNTFLCKILAILISYSLVLGLITLVLVYIIPQIVTSIGELITQIPAIYDYITNFLATLQTHYPNTDLTYISKGIESVLPNLMQTIQNFASNMVPALYSVSVAVFQWILNVFIALIISIYMLNDKKQLLHACRAILYAFLPEKWIPTFDETITECNRLFSGFVIGKTVDSLIIGIICFILMNLFRMPYTILISVIVGITNMIPYFGPFIGAVPGAFIILLISPLKSLLFLIMILCLQQFDGLILGPKILGNSTGLRPIWIIFAITAGGSIGGVIGMFIGVPVVSCIKYILGRILRYRLSKRPDALVKLQEKEQEPEHNYHTTLNLSIKKEKFQKFLKKKNP